MESKLLYIVTTPVQQKQNTYHFYAMDNQEVYECGLSNSKTTKAASQAALLKKDTTHLVRNYSISRRDQTPYLSLSDKTMIFDTSSQLVIQPERLHKFFHPEPVSLPDVDASPRKTRVSFEATIDKVYQTQEGKNWKRKDIVLNAPKDGHTSKRMCMKLWGNNSEQVTEADEGNNIIVTNGIVDKYQERTQINTNELTSIQIKPPDADVDGDVKITVIAAQQEEEGICMATDTSTVYIPHDIFKRDLQLVYTDLIQELPMTLCVTYKDGKINTIKKSLANKMPKKKDTATK